MSDTRPRRSTSIRSGGASNAGTGTGTGKTSSPKPVKLPEEKEKSKGLSPSSGSGAGAGPQLRHREFLVRSNLSMDASCSSDASTDSFCSRASTGRIGRRLSGCGGTIRSYTSGLAGRWSNSFNQPGKGKLGVGMGPTPAPPPEEMAGGKIRCAWITANTGLVLVCAPTSGHTPFLVLCNSSNNNKSQTCWERQRWNPINWVSFPPEWLNFYIGSPSYHNPPTFLGLDMLHQWDPCYVAFHDEEWGVPVHDDKRLFEMLVLSGALAELTWPSILSKRHVFREVFMDFEPVLVSKINERKLIATGGCATSLLSETKLRAIVENAREMVKIINEFGSFDRYIWGFVNNNPIVGRFRYQRQVPVRTSKADLISKDLVCRGFRGVGPTVIYSFMQVCGLTNDHLISCYRFDECNNIFQDGACTGSGTSLAVPGTTVTTSENMVRITDLEGLAANVDELGIS